MTTLKMGIGHERAGERAADQDGGFLAAEQRCERGRAHSGPCVCPSATS